MTLFVAARFMCFAPAGRARQLLSLQAIVMLQNEMIASQTGAHLEVLDELLRSLLHLIWVCASARAFEAAAAASAILRLV